MIVATVAESTPEDAVKWGRQARKFADIVELRIDALDKPGQFPDVLNRLQGPFIITCRSPEDGGEFTGHLQEKRTLLTKAVKRGVEYIDVSKTIPSSVRKQIGGTQILSYHNMDRTPTDLSQIVENLEDHEPDHMKIATQCNTLEDSLRLLDITPPSSCPISVMGMGECGLITRVLHKQSQSFFAYGSANPNTTPAPGQPSVQELSELYRIREITPSTDLYGLLGNPVSHSWSPTVFNQLFKEHDLDAVYLPLRMIQTQTVNTLVHQLDFQGFSVTLPHKRTIVSLLDEINPYAEQIEAVNTVVRRDGLLEGYNTDARAALESIIENWPDDRKENVPDEEESEQQDQDEENQQKSSEDIADPNSETLNNPITGQNILILGAGGAARAVLISLKEAGGEITVTNRTKERGETLARQFNVSFLPWEERTEAGDIDLLVNATSVGMKPNEDLTPFPAEALSSDTVVFDMVYTPPRTKLLKEARKLGCHTISGRDMFYRQAHRQFRLWTGIQTRARAEDG